MIHAAVAAHGRVVAAVVTQAKGSSPRDAGAIMLILPDRTIGTIGGGTVEQEITARARTMLAEGTPPESHEYPLGPDLDQCCGGHMSIALGIVDLSSRTTDQPDATSPLPHLGGGIGRGQSGLILWPGGPTLPELPAKRPVLIYGAGHVGQAITRALAPLPFSTTLIDARPPTDTNDGILCTPLPEAVVQESSADSFHLVLTHSHALDLEIVTAILSRRFGFCGLIGSATKRALFERRLSERGIPPAAIAELTCPIGLPMLRDKRPEVIAASVSVQLMLRDTVLREQP